MKSVKTRNLTVDSKKRTCPTITIEGADYKLCEESSKGKNFWGNSKKGKYGRGLCRSKDDPFKPARTGRLGELAVARLLDIGVDFSYREYGDNQDLLWDDKRIDVKTATRDYGSCLIYYMNEWGKIIPVNKDIYIFGYVEREDRREKFAEIILVGYLPQQKILECEVKPARRGNHYNYEVPFSNTYTIKQLLKHSEITL